MLKVGGIWVSPVEVEDTLSAHPAVLECAITARKDRSDLVKPMAFVVLNDGYEPSDELAKELIAYCASEMASYKRPRWIEFRDELPRTGTDKVQRTELAEAAGRAEAEAGSVPMPVDEFARAVVPLARSRWHRHAMPGRHTRRDQTC